LCAPENLQFSGFGFTVVELSQRQERFWLLRLFNAEMRESTPDPIGELSQVTVRRGARA
jgi:hypothetical protein